MSFESLGLSPKLVSTLKQMSYHKPSPIQTMGIPPILMGKDIIGNAQTGTGKTACFGLPILQLLSDSTPQQDPRALILTPTRELAQQVEGKIKDYSQGLQINTAAVYGGVDYRSQIKRLNQGVDILIATPGRLQDLVEGTYLKLHRVNYLVLDEADRMLDMGFQPAVMRILRQIPNRKQTLLFSATLSGQVRTLAQKLLTKPLHVQASPAHSTAQTVDHKVYPIDQGQKRAALSYLIGSQNWQQVLIFTRTKASAETLSRELHLDGINNMMIHGDRTQGQRNKALQKFKGGEIQALVATDIASRGLDIENLPFVVNYELPNQPEDYIHRIGRTGRAGKEGLAISLIFDTELYLLDAVEELIKTKIERGKIKGFEPRNFDPQKPQGKAKAIKKPFSERTMKSHRSLDRRHSYKGTGSKTAKGKAKAKKTFSKSSTPKKAKRQSR